jgi:carbonic anhydrase
MITINEVYTEGSYSENSGDIKAGQILLRAYFDWLLSSNTTSVCYINSMNPEQEITALPNNYDAFLIAKLKNEAAGCVALKSYTAGICEMKRLYVPPQYRGHKLGEHLVEAIIDKAKKLGYQKMRLDTIDTAMAHAIKIYEKKGFQKIERYLESVPSGHTLYYELDLKNKS